MGLSSIAVQQREKEDEALKSFIVFSLVGSVGLHVAVLSMSSLWVKETKLAEEPIEVVVLDTPAKVEAAPEPKPPPKIGDGSKPLTSAKSNPAPAAKLAPQQEAIAFSPPKVEKPISSKTTNIEKPVATPPTPVATPKIAEIPPTPIATPKVAEIPPTPVATPTPKVTETLPPVPTPLPEVVQTPTPVASLPSDLIDKLKSTPTPVATPPQVSQPQPVKRSPVAAKPPAQNNRLPDRVRSPNSEISDALKRPTTASQNSPTNSDRSLSPNSPNPAGNNSNLANNFGSSGAGSNNNNSSDRPSDNKVATAPSNNPNPASEDLLSPGSGSGGLACRRCPHPAYPKRAERRGLEGTVKVVFDADRNGNVSNVRVANSSGHDILDRAATQAVKGWKLASSDSEQPGILQSFTFAKKGSDIEQQARERREQQQERLAREKEQQERLAREQEQQERQQQEILNQNVPQPSTPPANFPEPLPTSTPIESDLTAPQP